MVHRRMIPLCFALAALASLAAPGVSEAACRARANGFCVHSGAACHPPNHGACRTVEHRLPGRDLHFCLCGTPGKPILLP